MILFLDFDGVLHPEGEGTCPTMAYGSFVGFDGEACAALRAHFERTRS
jgi:hypothetical protein